MKITKDDINSLNEIGNGTDGRVFKLNNKYLIKIYRSKIKEINDYNNDNKTKIYKKGKVKFKNIYDTGNFFDKDEVRLRNEDGLKIAIKKQNYVNRTYLPQDLVYIDNKFAGCLLKYVNGIQIHKLIGMPMVYKRKILSNLLNDIEELLTNNIYHTDLSNSPYCYTTFYDENNELNIKKGHSHVLVNPFTLNTNIIDLDGKSTSYTEYFNDYLLNRSITELTKLIIEFIYKIDLEEIKESDEIYFELLKMKLNKELAIKLANYNFESIEEIKKELKFS